MTKIGLKVPATGSKDSVAESEVTTALKAVEEWLNGKNIETTDNLKAGGIAEASLSTALQEKLTSLTGIVYASSGVSLEGASGKFYDMTVAATTLTLPAPTANRLIGVINNGVGAAVKVKASAGKIYGDFTEEVTEVSLALRQHLLLLATGSNWYIIAGEPKKTETYTVVKTYTKAEAEAGVEVSATRPASVIIRGGGTELTSIGGVTFEGSNGATYPVNPGQKIKGTAELKLQWLLG